VLISSFSLRRLECSFHDSLIYYYSKKQECKYKLDFSSKWLETFNANNNNETAYTQVKIAAKIEKYKILDLEKPFEFGEDFGLFTKKYKGAMFGIGSGINQPPLHSSTFDFPDELLEIGSTMFYQIATQILK
jgi:metal-dependent amidase/aminoacylase/carboxypeptidase family protein